MKCYQVFSNASPKWLAFYLLSALFLLSSASQLSAEEPAEKFLAALRERGYYRSALHYLDGAGKSEMVPAKFRKEVLFEKAKILIDSVGSVRDPDEISKRLDDADKLLTKQAKAVSDPLESTEIKKIQANVRYFRGRNYLKQATSEKTPKKKQAEYFTKSNQLLGDAIPKYREVQKAQQDQVENYQIDPQDPDSDKNLRKLQSSYVDTRLKIPVAMEKFALSFDSDKKQRNSKLVEAGKEFAAVAKKYDQRFVQGQMARAFAAKCYQQAGKYDRAFKLLSEVFDYPNPPKPLVREGLVVGVEIWPNVEPYPYQAVVDAASQPVSLLGRREKFNPTWLRIQLELARAMHEQSVALEKKEPKESKRLKSEASRMARSIARRPNPHSQMAAEMLGEWGVSVTAAGADVEPVEVADATDFPDAKTKSAELIQPLSMQLSELNKAKRGLAKSKGAAKETLAIEVDGLQASVNKQANQALAMLSQAVGFANDETPRADLNNVRYLQSYCYFAKGRYLNSAVIGQFLMEKYPTIDWSLQASSLMVRSYEEMFDNSTGPARELARNNVINAASEMLDRWADSDESAAAAVSATKVAVIDGDFGAANRFFEKIPANSATRGPLASKIGQQIWSNRKTATDDAAKKKMTQSAKKFFAAAVENADPASMDLSTAVSALYYIDALRETGDIDQSVTRADSLIQTLGSNQAVGGNKKMRQAVYNSSLSAYLAALSGKSNPQKLIGKAQDVIAKMAKEAKGDPAANQNVSRVYRRVAQDLQDKFDSLPNVKQQTKFADSLKSFFSAIGSGAKDGKTRLWAGRGLLKIAESLKLSGADAKGKELAAEAIVLLDAAKQAGFGGDEKLELNYQQQLALAQRSSGNYKEAVASFTKILEQTQGLSLQIDATKTLLLWGIDKKDTKVLTQSMNGVGDYRDPETNKPRKRIWGWKLLAKLTRSKEQFREQFRESQYYSVLCRLEYGKIAKSKKAVESAKGELGKAMQRYPDLATGPWKIKYEQLLKDLDSALKEL